MCDAQLLMGLVLVVLWMVLHSWRCVMKKCLMVNGLRHLQFRMEYKIMGAFGKLNVLGGPRFTKGWQKAAPLCNLDKIYRLQL